MNGCPLAPTQKELTMKQRVFLEVGIAEHINNEHDFQIRLQGGEPPKRNNHNIGRSKPIRPDEIDLTPAEIRERLKRNRKT